MRNEPVRKSEPDVRTNDFELEMLEAARIYQQQLLDGRAQAYMPAEVAAFIAGACWARQVLAKQNEVSS
jgi:hypothetical protein